jgi:hypothetical protein
VARKGGAFSFVRLCRVGSVKCLTGGVPGEDANQRNEKVGMPGRDRSIGRGLLRPGERDGWFGLSRIGVAHGSITAITTPAADACAPDPGFKIPGI